MRAFPVLHRVRSSFCSSWWIPLSGPPRLPRTRRTRSGPSERSCRLLSLAATTPPLLSSTDCSSSRHPSEDRKGLYDSVRVCSLEHLVKASATERRHLCVTCSLLYNQFIIGPLGSFWSAFWLMVCFCLLSQIPCSGDLHRTHAASVANNPRQQSTEGGAV